jgi:uncharacterized protein YeaO (DUF488 family)
MTTILWLIIVGILIERAWKYRVKKTDANTESWGRSITSVKDLWRWKE